MRRMELVVVFELVAIGMQSSATTSTTSSLEMQKTMRRRRRRRRRSKFHSSSSSKSNNTTQIFARFLKEMEFGSGTKHPPAKKLRTQCRFRKKCHI
jgi:hypothetical protein